MAWAELTNGVLPIKRVINSPKAIVDSNKVQHSSTIFKSWPKEELLVIGWTPFREETFDTSIYKSSGTVDNIVDGEVVRSHTTILKPIDVLKTQKISELKQKRDNVMHGGFEYSTDGGITKHSVQTDEMSLARISDAMIYMNKKILSGRSWRMKNNATVNFTASEFEAMAIASNDHVDACYINQVVHETVIETLATQQEVIGYDVTTGWPANPPQVKD